MVQLLDGGSVRLAFVTQLQSQPGRAVNRTNDILLPAHQRQQLLDDGFRLTPQSQLPPPRIMSYYTILNGQNTLSVERVLASV
jgi:hypothetical protein